MPYKVKFNKDFFSEMNVYRDKILSFHKEEKELIHYHYEEVDNALQWHGALIEINSKSKKTRLVGAFLAYVEILIYAEEYGFAKDKCKQVSVLLKEIDDKPEHSAFSRKLSQLYSKIDSESLLIKNNLSNEISMISEKMELLFENKRFEGVLDVFYLFFKKRRAFIQPVSIIEEVYKVIQNIEKNITIPDLYEQEIENKDPRVWSMLYRLYVLCTEIYKEAGFIHIDHFNKILQIGRVMIISFEEQLRNFPKNRKAAILKYYNKISIKTRDFISFIEIKKSILRETMADPKEVVLEAEMYLMQIKMCITAEDIKSATIGMQHIEKRLEDLKERKGYSEILGHLTEIKEDLLKVKPLLSFSEKDNQFFEEIVKINARLEENYYPLLYLYGRAKYEKITVQEGADFKTSIQIAEQLILDIKELAYAECQYAYPFEKICQLNELIEKSIPLIPLEKSVEEILSEIGEQEKQYLPSIKNKKTKNLKKSNEHPKEKKSLLKSSVVENVEKDLDEGMQIFEDTSKTYTPYGKENCSTISAKDMEVFHSIKSCIVTIDTLKDFRSFLKEDKQKTRAEKDFEKSRMFMLCREYNRAEVSYLGARAEARIEKNTKIEMMSEMGLGDCYRLFASKEIDFGNMMNEFEKAFLCYQNAWKIYQSEGKRDDNISEVLEFQKDVLPEEIKKIRMKMDRVLKKYQIIKAKGIANGTWFKGKQGSEISFNSQLTSDIKRIYYPKILNLEDKIKEQFSVNEKLCFR